MYVLSKLRGLFQMDGYSLCTRAFLAKDLELPRGWGWAERELPFSKNLFVKRELAGMDLTSHSTKYFSILPMSVCSDCVTTEHPTEISFAHNSYCTGQSVPAVEMGGRPERDPRNNGFEQHIISSKGQAEKAILGEALTIHY
jgi:hypothetical protein